MRRRDEMTQTIVIRPHRGWAGLGLGDLAGYGELLYFLIWRDLKVRYKQTLFGALWAVGQPVILMVVFTLVLGRLGGIAPGDIPYPLLTFTALVPWTLFSQSVSGASGSLVNASNLLQKVYFPRLLLPLAAEGSFLLDFAIAMLVLFGLMGWFGVFPTLAALWVIPLAILAAASALAVGVWLAAINVRYRDVRYAVPFLVQVGLFASPVAYPASVVPEGWRALFELNPMTGVIEGFRWALLGDIALPASAILMSILVTAVVLVTGLLYFHRVERTFADVI